MPDQPGPLRLPPLPAVDGDVWWTPRRVYNLGRLVEVLGRHPGIDLAREVLTPVDDSGWQRVGEEPPDLSGEDDSVDELQAALAAEGIYPTAQEMDDLYAALDETDLEEMGGDDFGPDGMGLANATDEEALIELSSAFERHAGAPLWAPSRDVLRETDLARQDASQALRRSRGDPGDAIRDAAGVLLASPGASAGRHGSQINLAEPHRSHLGRFGSSCGPDDGFGRCSSRYHSAGCLHAVEGAAATGTAEAVAAWNATLAERAAFAADPQVGGALRSMLSYGDTPKLAWHGDPNDRDPSDPGYAGRLPAFGRERYRELAQRLGLAGATNPDAIRSRGQVNLHAQAARADIAPASGSSLWGSRKTRHQPASAVPWGDGLAGALVPLTAAQNAASLEE